MDGVRDVLGYFPQGSCFSILKFKLEFYLLSFTVQKPPFQFGFCENLTLRRASWHLDSELSNDMCRGVGKVQLRK